MTTTLTTITPINSGSKIYKALAAVMADVDHVAKRDRNEAQKFLFRGIDAVVNAVGPVLRKHNVMVLPTVEAVTYAAITSRNGGSLTSCRVEVTYTFFADDGSSVPCRVAAEAFDSGDKATPKAMSVAFRTALLQALALPTDDPEPDAQSYQTAAPVTAPREQTQQAQASEAAPTQRMSRQTSGITEPQSKKMHALFREAGMDRDAALAFVESVAHPVTTTNELTKLDAGKVIDRLESIKADKEAAAEEIPGQEGLPL